MQHKVTFTQIKASGYDSSWVENTLSDIPVSSFLTDISRQG